MRWHVEVTAIGKTDLQKFCVEAESWQRALQAARAQRGEEGPMSGFSIELLEEGYRAVDPVARVRFVVKRAPDDAPITAPLAKENGKAGVAPSPPSPASPPSPPSLRPGAAGPPSAKPASPVSVPPASAKKSGGPPRPGPPSNAPPAPSSKKSAPPAAPEPAAAPAPVPVRPPPAALLPIGTSAPGLPLVKVLSSREQDPTDASPLTYREYSFAVPAGTSEAEAVDVLRDQLKIVDAHMANAKMGKLVNLAVFDVEFSGKPPGPPLATLTWKDWKGEPVIGYPRRGQVHKQTKPPTAGAQGPASQAPVASQLFPPPPSALPPSAAASPAIIAAAQQATAAAAQAAPVSVVQPAPAAPASGVQPAPAFPLPGTPGSVPPPAIISAPPASGPVSAPPSPASAVPPPPAAILQPAPMNNKAPSEPPPKRQSSHPPPAEGMVRTPSGRFVRGRVTGDELITALFESMHDLHFLRDALDGGQFCLALATEMLPARVALIHFFDIEKREWVVACTRGKDASRLLTLRTPESDEILRDAARSRRAMVHANGPTTEAQRYQTIGGGKSLIVAPIMQAGRALGAIEIVNPLDGMPFNEDEGNAMTYIAEQYAEYLGSRGIVLDRDRIQSAAAPR